MEDRNESHSDQRTPDLNQASYELILATSIVGITAEAIRNLANYPSSQAGENYANALFAASDCIQRAKAIIDCDGGEP